MNQKGFTLLELLVVVAILVLVFGLSIASFNTFNRRERLKQAALNFKSVLRLAQTRAISVDKPTNGCTTFVGLWVEFTETSYSTRYECSEGLVGSPETAALPGGVSFAKIGRASCRERV